MVKILLGIIIFFVLIFIFLKSDDIYNYKEVIFDNLIIEKNDNGKIGMTIGGYDDGNGVKIDKITESGPAYTAGLKLDDKLLEIDGVNVENLRYDDVLNLLKSVKKVLNLKVFRTVKEFKN